MRSDPPAQVPKIHVASPYETVFANPEDALTASLRAAIRAGTDAALAESSEEADLIVLVERWGFKGRKHAREYERDEFLRTNAGRIFVVNFDDYAAGYWPGCYTSLTNTNFDERHHRACVYPKDYNESAACRAVEHVDRRYLFSFQGTLHSHPVRGALYEALRGDPRGRMIDVTQAFHSHSSEQKQRYVETIRSSVFVLCPRGASPSTYRLYETMSQGRCPVIISDDWIPPEEVDWDEFALRVAEADIASLADVLHEHRSEGDAKGQRALEVWRDEFSGTKRFEGYVRKILQLWREGDGLDMRRLSARWRSRDFRAKNGWLLRQRAARLIAQHASSN